MRKALLAATLTAGLAAGGAVGAISFGPGLAGAQATTSSTAQPSTATQPPADHSAVLSGALQSLVDDGTITSAQRDAVVNKLATNPGGGRHGGPGGPGGHGAMGPMGGHAADLAKALGLTTDELRTEMQSGKSLAEIAKAHNVDSKTVVDALVASEIAEIDAQVTAGRLTAAQAATLTAELATRIQAMVDGTAGPGGPGGFDGGRGGRGPGGPGRPGTAAPSSSTPAG